MNSNEYNMNYEKLATIILFNPKKCKDGEQDGSCQDVERLKKVFKKIDPKIKILVYEDLNVAEAESKIKKLSDDYKKSACVIVIILTHGKKKDEIMFKLDSKINLYRITGWFTPDKIPELAGKPKVFFIQAYRDENSFKSFESDNKLVTDMTDTMTSLPPSFHYPLNADFLIGFSSEESKCLIYVNKMNTPILLAFSCILDDNSYRDINNGGSWYIQSLCDVLERESLPTTSILEILTRVNLEISKKNNLMMNQSWREQISSFESNLTRDLYFKKGNPDIVNVAIDNTNENSWFCCCKMGF